jgi:hypothetical protein
VDLQHVKQVISFGGGEDDTGYQAHTHLGAIEVHSPVCGIRSQRQVLILSLVSKEISQDLGDKGIDNRARYLSTPEAR